MRRGRWLALLVCQISTLSSLAQTYSSVHTQADRRQAASAIERAIEEFKHQTRALGLRVDGTARRKPARTLRWHGRLFWNVRNDFFDAVPHEVRQTGGTKGLLRRNQYGFSVSGPLAIPKLPQLANRTFVSLSYEGMREKLGQHYIRTIPIVPERSGDFSQTVDKAGQLLPIYDPLSTRPNPNYDPAQPVSLANLQYLRDPFPSNRIPPSRLDPVALEAVTQYPLPNAAIGPFFQNNYVVYAPEVNRADGGRGKIDHSLGESQRLTFNFSLSNGFESPPRLFPTAANPGRPDRQYRSRSASIQHTWTLSPTTLHSFNVGGWTSRSQNKPVWWKGATVFPVMRFSPYLPMGTAYPLSRTAWGHFELSDTLSSKRGKHSFHLNAHWRWSRVHSFWPQYPEGRFDFNEGLTSLPGIINTGHAFASFLLGLAAFAERTVVEHPSYFRAQIGEFFLRDEWEPTEGLTVHLQFGLDVSTPRIEKYDRQSTVDLTVTNPTNGRPGALIFAGRDAKSRAFQPVRVRPETYVSLSWSPWARRQLILRASFRRYYTEVPLRPGQWGTQGFNAVPTAISPNTQLQPALRLVDGPPRIERSLPDLRPDAANDTVADLIDRSSAQPTYTAASFSIQRELPGAFIATLGFHHTSGKSMLAGNEGVNLNAIPLDALIYRDLLNEERFRRELRPYPHYQGFDVYGSYPVGRFQREEAYLSVEKRTSHGLSLRFVYTFSKQLDDYSTPDGLQDYYNRRKEWALTYYNDPHQVSLVYMYELPFGQSGRWLRLSGWRRYLVEGWSISGTTSYSSGDPLWLRAMFNNTGGVVRTLYVNAVPGVNPQVKHRNPERWFNPEAFVNPPDFSIGNVPRSHPKLYNPARQNHDLALTKRIPLGMDRAVELMATAFNFPNHANWNRPDTEIGTRQSPNVNAGRIIGSRGGRVLQLGLRFAF